jgi:protein-tyrosine phosphatase
MMAPRSQTDDRVLLWDGCLNVRDLGGLPTASGTTALRSVLRSDSLRKLSDAGWKALLDYGVTRIVDLRADSELADDPPRDLPIEVIHVAVVPDFDSQHWAEIDALVENAPDATTNNRTVYLEMLERFNGGFARAIEAIAAAEDGAVVVHCVGGKDRTGLVSALVLRLAGVSIADVAADYALSEIHLRPELEQWIAAADTEEERRQRERRSHTPAAAMVGVLEELERRYGSVASYLQRAGVPAHALRCIRERLAA